jgi:hypothetical protein
MATPITITILAYQVGFGDCFLLRFTYDDGTKKHILIDFGTMGMPKDKPTASMKDVANSIAEKCNGMLDAVVATHRHADHISGFATATDGNGSGDIIAALKPKVVIQPWTEAPDAPENWEGPDGSAPRTAFARHTRSLAAMNVVAQSVVERLDRANGFDRNWPLANRLRFIGEDNISNLSAVKNLAKMGAVNNYVFHGGDAGLGRILPGVKTHVLGPPTLRQTDEFWLRAPAMMAMAPDATPGSETSLFPDEWTLRRIPTEMRWVADRVAMAEADQMLGIVTALDKAMNNTSVILLFEAGSKKLLFPGDAQLENWMYALDQKWVRDLLDDVDVYKVGHHGSLNATPKSLWNRFSKRGPRGKPGRMTSVLSTMAGKHGGKHGSPTEVPRIPLVDALKADSDLHNTQDLPAMQLFEEIEIDLG